MPWLGARGLCMPAAVDLRDVRKTFGTKVAVERLSLTIGEGELVGLIGPNGAGKTTSIRMIMSIIFPDSGALQVLGRASAVESKDRIGYLPEERGLYKKMRVGAFLEYVAKLKGIDGAGLEGTIREWLERVALGDCFKKRCEELSKGMQQKVQFIASVIHKPDLLILDEPFSGLDPVNARLLRTLVEDEHKRGCTLIFSTHQMAQAEALCDRVVMIHQGKKVLDDPLGAIFARYTPRAISLEPACAGSEVASRLAGLAGVLGVRAHDDHATVDLDHGADGQALIPMIAARVPVRAISLVRPTLEDVFIEIVAGTAGSDDQREQLRLMMHAARAGEGSGD